MLRASLLKTLILLSTAPACMASNSPSTAQWSILHFFFYSAFIGSLYLLALAVLVPLIRRGMVNAAAANIIPFSIVLLGMLTIDRADFLLFPALGACLTVALAYWWVVKRLTAEEDT